MKSVIERFTDVLIRNEDCSAEEKEVVMYGLARAMEYFVQIVSMFVLSIFLGMAWEMFWFSLSFFSLRCYTGGIHARNSLECYFISMGMVLVVLLLQKLDLLSVAFAYFAMIVGTVLIFWIAPIGDSNKPLDAIEKKVYRKRALIRLTLNIIAFVVCRLLMLENALINISLSVAVISFSLLLGKIKNHFYEMRHKREGVYGQ